MGMYVQSNGTATPIPGGIPSDILERIENDIEQLRALRAGFEHYGMAMLTDSETVTDRESGLALWAGQNNAAIEGTLANRIEKINGYLSELEILRPENFFEDFNGNTVEGFSSYRNQGFVHFYSLIKFKEGTSIPDPVLYLKEEICPEAGYALLDLLEGVSPYRFVGKIWISSGGNLNAYSQITPGKSYYISGSWKTVGTY